jgi:hypothetical protein
VGGLALGDYALVVRDALERLRSVSSNRGPYFATLTVRPSSSSPSSSPPTVAPERLDVERLEE